MIVSLVLRAFQLIFAAVVLALSVVLINHQGVGKAPATTGYGAFCGGWGLVAAAIGVAAIFIEAIPAIVMMAIDGLSSLLFLAGGIALTVAMKGIQCKTDEVNAGRMSNNKILNGGCAEVDGEIKCSYGDERESDEHNFGILKARCIRAQADYVFLFLAFALFLGAVGLTFFVKKRGGHKRGMVV